MAKYQYLAKNIGIWHYFGTRVCYVTQVPGTWVPLIIATMAGWVGLGTLAQGAQVSCRYNSSLKSSRTVKIN